MALQTTFLFLLLGATSIALSSGRNLDSLGKSEDSVRLKRSAQGYCHASGDPHYLTFDGYRYDFQGGCRYVHSTDACPRTGQSFASFRVIADNTGSGVTTITNVEVQIHGHSIHLTRGANPPAQANAVYSISYEPGIVIRSKNPAGVTVKWDKSTTLEVILDPKFRGKVCGLCGNFDGNRGNELVKKDGTTAGSINDWGHSWIAGGQCGVPNPPNHPCLQHPGKRAEAHRVCSVIKSSSFASCKARIDVEPLYRNCLYDVCAMPHGHEAQSACDAIKEAATECAEKTQFKVALDWDHLEDKCISACKVKTTGGKCCVFPFIYGGKTYPSCTTVDYGNTLWCATTENYDKDYQWGTCTGARSP